MGKTNVLQLVKGLLLWTHVSKIFSFDKASLRVGFNFHPSRKNGLLCFEPLTLKIFYNWILDFFFISEEFWTIKIVKLFESIKKLIALFGSFDPENIV